MKGNQQVIEQLNLALKAELTAIVQYMIQGEMQANWGYKRLGAYIKKQAIDEMRHAEGLIERILFLDGAPDANLQLSPQVGLSVKQQLENDLADEMAAVGMYNNAVEVCEKAGDNGSRALFEGMVKDEEQHTDWLEAQLHIIGESGYDNYLSQQMHGK
jgi:bacterioferritin